MKTGRWTVALAATLVVAGAAAAAGSAAMIANGDFEAGTFSWSKSPRSPSRSERRSSRDPHYAGATPSSFVEGKGITCDAPPSGYTQHAFAGNAQQVPAGVYAYYSAG